MFKLFEKYLKYRRKRLLLEIASQSEVPTREQLIEHYENLMIRTMNQESDSEKAMFAVSTGVLRLIDPINEDGSTCTNYSKKES